MQKLRYAALTHQGCVRSNNEDNFYIERAWKKRIQENVFETHGEHAGEYLIASVCDGMGGQDLGEVASLLAIQCLDECFGQMQTTRSSIWRNLKKQLFSYKGAIGEAGVNSPESVKEEKLRENPMRYVTIANNRICGEMTKLKKNMGTTFAAVEFCEDAAVAVNIGDSPIYRFHSGILREISVEHSPVGSLIRDGILSKEEARQSPLKNKVSQYLGIFPDEMTLVPAVSDPIPLITNDQYLLCSDGLSNMLTEEDMISVLKTNDSAEDKTNQLVRKAMENGGKDNITVVLVEVG